MFSSEFTPKEFPPILHAFKYAPVLDRYVLSESEGGDFDFILKIFRFKLWKNMHFDPFKHYPWAKYLQRVVFLFSTWDGRTLVKWLAEMSDSDISNVVEIIFN